MTVRVAIEALVNPTEDEEKVVRALHNIFPEISVQRIVTDNGKVKLRLSGNGLPVLATLRNLIKQDRIRSAARGIIFRGTEGTLIQFYLNKQAAFAGRASFCEPLGESAQGPITVEIVSDNPSSVVDYLAAIPGQGGYQRFHET
jgi:hypothetical protein